VGPCSWIVGLEVKNLERVSLGGRFLRKAWQKEEVLERRRVVRAVWFKDI